MFLKEAILVYIFLSRIVLLLNYSQVIWFTMKLLFFYLFYFLPFNNIEFEIAFAWDNFVQ